MAGRHHRLDGREFEWTPEVRDGQGALASCNSWGHKELDMTERLNWTELNCDRSRPESSLLLPHQLSVLQLTAPAASVLGNQPLALFGPGKQWEPKCHTAEATGSYQGRWICCVLLRPFIHSCVFPGDTHVSGGSKVEKDPIPSQDIWNLVWEFEIVDF